MGTNTGFIRIRTHMNNKLKINQKHSLARIFLIVFLVSTDTNNIRGGVPLYHPEFLTTFYTLLKI